MTTIGPYELNTIVTGDARVLAESIPSESVDLIFTDPVYQNIDDYEWLARTAARVLKPDRACLVWCGTRTLFESQRVMELSLEYGWLVIWYQANSRSFIKSDLGHHHYAPLLWMKKGNNMPNGRYRDHLATTWNNEDFNHNWSKHPKVISYYINAFTRPGDVVADFFCGGGTVPAVAKMLGVNYWACEIDPGTATRARERVLLTQAPLFVMPELEQLELLSLQDE